MEACREQCKHFMHSRILKSVDPRIPTLSGRCTCRERLSKRRHCAEACREGAGVYPEALPGERGRRGGTAHVTSTFSIEFMVVFR